MKSARRPSASATARSSSTADSASARSPTDLSHTFIVGERSSKWAPSTWVGVLSGGRMSPARVTGEATFPPNSEHEEEAVDHNFSSFHPTGTHFLAADGAVHLIASEIDMELYQALCTRSGGEPVDRFFVDR